MVGLLPGFFGWIFGLDGVFRTASLCFTQKFTEARVAPLLLCLDQCSLITAVIVNVFRPSATHYCVSTMFRCFHVEKHEMFLVCFFPAGFTDPSGCKVKWYSSAAANFCLRHSGHAGAELRKTMVFFHVNENHLIINQLKSILFARG